MMEQGSKEWIAARCGLVTASRINDVMAKIKTGEAATRRNYRAQVVAERMTGKPTESFTNAAMQWGTENEPFARAAYEMMTNLFVEQVGLINHPEIMFSGASPDGLVDTSGLVEIKCPNTATHISYVLSGSAPSEYQNQMLWQMECTGREWCDFVSFDPRMPEHMQIYIARFNRDQTRIDEIKKEVIKFLGEVEQEIEGLNKAFLLQAPMRIAA